MQKNLNAPAVERGEMTLEEGAQQLVNDILVAKARFDKALDGRSEFYSRILGEDISWRKALRVGVVLPLLAVMGAVCVAQAPLVSLGAAAGAAWITYRLNQEEE